MSEDPFRYFRIEADELLTAMGKDALALEKGDRAAGVRLLRRAHTLKGAAGVVGLGEVVTLAHAIEDRLEPWREGSEVAPAEVVDAVLALCDEAREAIPPLPGAGGSDAEEAAEAPAGGRKEEAGGSGWVRVEGRALGELVAALDGARRALQSLGGAARDSALQVPLSMLERELRMAAHAADRLRHVPLAELGPDLERVVRDTARAEGKEARLVLESGDTRVEAEVLSALREILLHLTTNAVAHGIEAPAERLARGKSREGTLEVRLGRRGQRLLMTVKDDGRGFDLGALRRAGEQAGHLAPGAAEPRSAEEIESLAFVPGVSSRASADHRSGRGMGLETVRASLRRLGGDITWESRPGEGLQLSCEMPASRTRIPALVLGTGERTWAVPLHAVRGVFRAAEVDLVEEGDRGRVRVGTGPSLLAGTLSSLAGGTTEAEEQVLVRVDGGGLDAGLWVEAVYDTREVVVEPLPEIYRHDSMFLGCYSDGGAVPRLVLDPIQLAERIAAGLAPPRARVAAPRPPLLVVDDSVTSRMLEKSILESDGWEVDLAASGEEALEALSRRRYGLVLVDVEMPGMSGVELVRRVRTDPSLTELPMIVVSSRASEADRARGRSAGADDWVDKNRFEQGYLLGRIRELVG